VSSLDLERPAAPGRAAGGRAAWVAALAWLGRYALAPAVGAAVLALAFNGGSYSATIRDPIAVALWWALALGVAVSLWPLARTPRAALACGGLLAAFAALSAASIAWTDSQRALDSADRVVLYLGIFAVVVVMTRRRSARRWADGLAIGITAVGLVALASRLLPGVVHSPDLSGYFGGLTYLNYPLEYWNALAILVALGLPLLLSAAAGERPAWVRGLALAPVPALAGTLYLTSSRGGLVTAAVGIGVFVALTNRRGAAVRALALAGLSSAAAIVVLTDRPQLSNGPFGTHAAASQGRSAALLIGLICLLAGVIQATGCGISVTWPRLRLGRRAAQLMLVAGIVVLAAGVVAADPAKRIHDFQQPPASQAAQPAHGGSLGTSSHLFSGASDGRWQFWQAAVSEFRSHPLAGGGAGSYAAWWDRHGTISYVTGNAHSLYLETLGELGVLGLLLVLGVIAAAAFAAWRRWRAARGEDRATVAALAAVLAGFAVAAGIDWMWQMTVVGAVGIVAMALLTGPATEPAEADTATDWPRPSLSGPHGRRWRRIAVRGALVMGSLVLIAAEGVPFLAQTKISDSQNAAAAGRTATALHEARTAAQLEPWASAPHLQSALVLEGAGEFKRAELAIGEAIANSPSDWSLWLVASRIHREAGDLQAASRDHAQARSLNPRSPIFTTESG
jgi:hypothetical protein